MPFFMIGAFAVLDARVAGGGTQRTLAKQENGETE